MGDPGWVLVVDDDANDRMVLFGLLERFGHHATVVDNGPSALELLRAEPIDLVLLDLRMPEVDGYAVLDTMKAEPRLRPVPVIILSEGGDREKALRCVEIGAADYLDKPVDPVLLRARVAARLTYARLHREHLEYVAIVGHLAEAVQAVGTDRHDPSALDAVARRADTLGALARAVRQVAGNAGVTITLRPTGPVPTTDGPTTARDTFDDPPGRTPC